MNRAFTFIMRAGLQSTFFLLVSLFAFSQTRTVTGTVTSFKTNEPLSGVSVTVKGSKVGTQTDEVGNFSLEVPANTKAIVFSFVGFGEQEMQLSSSNTLNVKMNDVGQS